jgi:hypothetical protein
VADLHNIADLRNSTVRHDTGAGACEIVWVEQLEVR